jgi:hypothetical protein
VIVQPFMELNELEILRLRKALSSTYVSLRFTLAVTLQEVDSS